MLLGLYWQHWPPKLRRGKYTDFYARGFTTVDHVLKTLSLGHLTQEQVAAVGHKRDGLLHQRKFAHYCAYYHGEQLMSDKWSYFAIQGKEDQKRDLQRLVRNKRIELLSPGVEIAKTLEARFEELYGLTKESYLAECKRIAALFNSEAAHAAASVNYRRKVEEDLSHE
jgi:hypothetical protein